MINNVHQLSLDLTLSQASEINEANVAGQVFLLDNIKCPTSGISLTKYGVRHGEYKDSHVVGCMHSAHAVGEALQAFEPCD